MRTHVFVMGEMSLHEKLVFFASRGDVKQLSRALRSFTEVDKGRLITETEKRLVSSNEGSSQEAFAEYPLVTLKAHGVNFIVDKIGKNQLQRLLYIYNKTVTRGLLDDLQSRAKYFEHRLRVEEDEEQRRYACLYSPVGAPIVSSFTRCHPKLQVKLNNSEIANPVYSLSAGELVIRYQLPDKISLGSEVDVEFPRLIGINDWKTTVKGRLESFPRQQEGKTFAKINFAFDELAVNDIMRYIKLYYELFPLIEPQELVRITNTTFHHQGVLSQKHVIPILCVDNEGQRAPKYLIHTPGNAAQLQHFLINAQFKFEKTVFDEAAKASIPTYFVSAIANVKGGRARLFATLTNPLAKSLISVGIKNHSLSVYKIEFKAISAYDVSRAKALYKDDTHIKQKLDSVSAIAYVTHIDRFIDSDCTNTLSTNSDVLTALTKNSSYKITSLLPEKDDRRVETRYGLATKAFIKNSLLSSIPVQIVDFSASGLSVYCEQGIGALLDKDSLNISIPKLKSSKIPYKVVGLDSDAKIIRLQLEEEHSRGLRYQGFFRDAIDRNPHFFQSRDLGNQANKLYICMTYLVGIQQPNMILRVENNKPFEKSLERCFSPRDGGQGIKRFVQHSQGLSTHFNGKALFEKESHNGNCLLAQLHHQQDDNHIVTIPSLNNTLSQSEQCNMLSDPLSYLITRSDAQNVSALSLSVFSRHLNRTTHRRKREQLLPLKDTRSFVSVDDISDLVVFLSQLGFKLADKNND